MNERLKKLGCSSYYLLTVCTSPAKPKQKKSDVYRLLSGEIMITFSTLFHTKQLCRKVRKTKQFVIWNFPNNVKINVLEALFNSCYKRHFSIVNKVRIGVINNEWNMNQFVRFRTSELTPCMMRSYETWNLSYK